MALNVMKTLVTLLDLISAAVSFMVLSTPTAPFSSAITLEGSTFRTMISMALLQLETLQGYQNWTSPGLALQVKF
ncbi:hypothetical protein Godav_018133, partial [Gossypium davidsonii]|nr:hypothetical protein [Gossypium davidsonii]